MYIPSFFTGALIKRVGSVHAVLWAGLTLIAVAASGILWAWPGSFAAKLVCLTLIGVGWNWAFIGSTVLLTQSYLPAEKATAQGFNDMAVSFSTGLAMLLPPFFIAAFGWDSLVWTLTIAVIIMLVTSVACATCAGRSIAADKDEDEGVEVTSAVDDEGDRSSAV
jgi:MFS family permease